MPDAAALLAAWAAVLPALQASGRLPAPPLGAAELERVAVGEVVKLRLAHPDGDVGAVDRGVGVAWVPVSADALWLAILDDLHNDLVSGLTELHLRGTTPARKVLYQHLDLPLPFQDRHWVLEIRSNAELFASSGAWERSWVLDARGVASLAEVPGGAPAGALWTPVNEGGWLLVPVDGGTLVTYQVRTDIGGSVPQELVLRYALATLDELIRNTSRIGAGMAAHYQAGHAPIARPDGAALPHW